MEEKNETKEKKEEEKTETEEKKDEEKPKKAKTFGDPMVEIY